MLLMCLNITDEGKQKLEESISMIFGTTLNEKKISAPMW